VAVIVSVPVGKDDVAHIAIPPDRVTPEHSEVLPLAENETLPEGAVTPLGPVTVAVKVTDAPNAEGLVPEVTETAGVPLLTV
jgi:hypothetical protein